MEPGSLPLLLLATTLVGGICLRAGRKLVKTPAKASLTWDGIAAAFLVGFCSLATGLRGLVLLVFYQCGTMATKYKQEKKAKLDGTSDHGAQRNATQVLACSVIATMLSLWHAWRYGAEQPLVFGVEGSKTAAASSSIASAVLAHYATCLADTWASELGMLVPSAPRFILNPWRIVPRGTNGGVTIGGLVWSWVGGMVIAVAWIACDYGSGILIGASMIPRILLFGGLTGLLGSLMDSFLGATLQATWYDVDAKQVVVASTDNNHQRTSSVKKISGLNLLTNEQVNLVSVALTTYVGGWILGPMMLFDENIIASSD